jgi:hypothetical protein
MSLNQAAGLKVGQLARDMARGYAAHIDAIVSIKKTRAV